MGTVVPPAWPFLDPATLYKVIMQDYWEEFGPADCESVEQVVTSGNHTGQVITDWLAGDHECKNGEGLHIPFDHWAEKILEIWST